mmetsp:Transcript_74331/g.217945  ORF Transcript_74331/g.217945 Transcript_74331/m.217945 type:complete len:204 (+) Transcript_74331:164-775(+)
MDTSATKGPPPKASSKPSSRWKTGAQGRAEPIPPSASGPVSMGTGPSRENQEAMKTPPLESSSAAPRGPRSFTSSSKGTSAGSSQRSRTAASCFSVSHTIAGALLPSSPSAAAPASAEGLSEEGAAIASTTGARSAKASPRQRTPWTLEGGRKAQRRALPQHKAHRILIRRGTSRQSEVRSSWRAWRNDGSTRSESGSDPNTS